LSDDHRPGRKIDARRERGCRKYGVETTVPHEFFNGNLPGRQMSGVMRRDTDALEFWTKISNISGVPIVVALSGVCLAITKTRRRSAQ